MTALQSNVITRLPGVIDSIPEYDHTAVYNNLMNPNDANDDVRQILDKPTQHTRIAEPDQYTDEQVRSVDPPYVPRQAQQRLRETFRCLQQFEGVVLSVQHDEFTARLIDRSGKQPDDEADFPIAEVSEEDKSYVLPGIVFYWNIYYVDKADGQRTRSFELRFRRLPKWELSDIEEAKRKAACIADAIGWKQQSGSATP